MVRDLLMILGAFVLASVLAGALGAVNLGTALAFGQIALAATTVYVNLKLASQDMNALLATVDDRPPTVIETSRDVKDENLEASLEVGSEELVHKVVMRDNQPFSLAFANKHLRLPRWAGKEGPDWNL